MEHLINDVLPGCATLQEAEARYLLDARQMELRLMRVAEPGHRIGLKEVEHHLDELKKVDPEVYVTILYARSRLSAICCDLTDEQLRNAIKGTGNAIGRLYGDDRIRGVVWHYRYRGHEARVSEDMLAIVQERVRALLPRMLKTVEKRALKRRDAVPRQKISEGVYTGHIDPEEFLSPILAQAVLRLRALVYLRHPIDLVREINNWEREMECCE